MKHCLRACATASTVFLLASGAQSETVEDRSAAMARLKQVLETERTGEQVDWSTPGGGSRGHIKVLQTYYVNDRIPCRDYERTLAVAGTEGYRWQGTGCRVDGDWYMDERNVAKPPEAVARRPAPESRPAAAPPLKEEEPSVRSEEPTGVAEAPPPPERKPLEMPEFGMPSKSEF